HPRDTRLQPADAARRHRRWKRSGNAGSRPARAAVREGPPGPRSWRHPQTTSPAAAAAGPVGTNAPHLNALDPQNRCGHPLQVGGSYRTKPGTRCSYDVSHGADGVDERQVEAGVDLLSEARDEDFDRPGVVLVIPLPDAFAQFRARKGAARLLHEDLQQFEFARRERDGTSATRDTSVVHIHM